MKVHLHPDGCLFIRGSNDVVLYEGTLEEAAADGVQLPTLPEGMVSFIYDVNAGIFVYYDSKHNAFPMEGTARIQELDAAVADLARLAAASQVRKDLPLALAENATRDLQKRLADELAVATDTSIGLAKVSVKPVARAV